MAIRVAEIHFDLSTAAYRSRHVDVGEDGTCWHGQKLGRHWWLVGLGRRTGGHARTTLAQTLAQITTVEAARLVNTTDVIAAIPATTAVTTRAATTGVAYSLAAVMAQVDDSPEPMQQRTASPYGLAPG